MLVSAFILGFLGSIHCIGMCGPIAMALPYGRFGGSKSLLARGVYQLGRLSTYAIIGLIFGFLGMSLEFVSGQQYLSIFMGTIMLLFVIFPWIFRFSGGNKILDQINTPIRKAFSKLIHQENTISFYLSGTLNGLLPCGLVWIALASALAIGNSIQSSLFMLFFGLGTLPAMIGVVFSFEAIKRKFSFSYNKISRIIALTIGILLIIRGLNMGNYLSPYFDFDEAKRQIITVCGLDH